MGDYGNWFFGGNDNSLDVQMMPEIGQVELFVGDGTIPDGWYLCEGREPPSGIQKNEEVMEILDKYGGMPDFRPAKAVIYLGGSNDR